MFFKKILPKMTILCHATLTAALLPLFTIANKQISDEIFTTPLKTVLSEEADITLDTQPFKKCSKAHCK